MRSHESINAVKSLFSEELKPEEQDWKTRKISLSQFYWTYIHSWKKTYSDITSSLTSFLGAEKKNIIYIYIPHTGSSYFRFVSTNINHLLLDPTSFLANFRRVIMQFSTALLFNKTGVTLCCLVKFLDV